MQNQVALGAKHSASPVKVGIARSIYAEHLDVNGWGCGGGVLAAGGARNAGAAAGFPRCRITALGAN
jgi:hypothetical protein